MKSRIEIKQEKEKAGGGCRHIFIPNTFSDIFIYFRYRALQITDGLHNMGSLNWPMFGCLAAIELMCFAFLFKGVKLTGKVCFSEILPTVCLKHPSSHAAYYSLVFFCPFVDSLYEQITEVLETEAVLMYTMLTTHLITDHIQLIFPFFYS